MYLNGGYFLSQSFKTPGNANGNQDQPSPISVLDLQFEDDDTSGCSGDANLNEHGTTLSWDEHVVGPITPVHGKTSTTPLSPDEEEQECFLYVQMLLSVAGIDRDVQSTRWHLPESPLDPSLREKGTQKDITFWDGGYEDDVAMVVESVVRKEVVRKVWAEHLTLQIDHIKLKIEDKLVEELVEESVLELTVQGELKSRGNQRKHHRLNICLDSWARSQAKLDNNSRLLDFIEKKQHVLGNRLIFVTNNSTKSRRRYGEKFETLGLSVNEEEIFASSCVAAAYLRSIDFPKYKKPIMLYALAEVIQYRTPFE
ncbi:hypothetical protein CTI12_AA392070 [Artemisia annua]|uniref:Uncharacterized protein n=1 Tax=Artemisia annua TaxID=35608 RepID=A0A2U1MDN6_ARTAN|nr:hypothetical protein CTI12_AA392070 [Artemisia annua]